MCFWYEKRWKRTGLDVCVRAVGFQVDEKQISFSTLGIFPTWSSFSFFFLFKKLKLKQNKVHQKKVLYRRTTFGSLHFSFWFVRVPIRLSTNLGPARLCWLVAAMWKKPRKSPGLSGRPCHRRTNKKPKKIENELSRPLPKRTHQQTRRLLDAGFRPPARLLFSNGL